MGQWRRATIRDITLDVRLWLISETGLDATRVFISVLSPEDTPVYGAPQDIILSWKAEEPDEGIIDGAGRYDNRRKRTLEVTCRTRLALDPGNQDHSRLTDESLGHFALEDSIVDALELYQPGEGDTIDVLAAPLRVGRLTEPKRRRGDGHWVYSTFTVSVEYRRDLDITRV